MGLLDFLKKKDKTQNSQVEAPKPVVEEPKSDIELTYSSGIKARIDFGEVINKDGKYIQEIHITYLHPDGFFEGKDYLIEPHLIRKSDGNMVYDTKAYYNELEKRGYHSYVKGMFKKEEIDEIVNHDKTDYIGDFDFSRDGRPTRTFDEDFRKKYIEECRRLREEKTEIDRQRDMQRIEDAVERAKYNTAYNRKDSHAQRLSPDMLENPSAPDDFSM